MKDSCHNTIVVGSTCRALAWSARRAGLTVHACDPYHDRDLEAIASLHQPEDVLQLAKQQPGAYLLCAGGCEHKVDELEDWCGQYQLQCLGPTPSSMRLLRDQGKWKAWAESCGLRFPESYLCEPMETLEECLSRWGAKHSPDDQWLWKTLASGGGYGVRDFESQARLPGPGLIQRKIDGRLLSITIWADSRGGLRLLPVMASIDHRHRLSKAGACPSLYGYRGSLGPIPINPEQAALWQGIAKEIYRDAPWVGWIQIDWILDASGEAWLLEINPRWSASMELLEAMDHASWVQRLLASSMPQISIEENGWVGCGYWGKLILYAKQPLHVDSETSDRWWQHAWVERAVEEVQWTSGCWLADIPKPRTSIAAGEPILTILARGTSLHEVERLLAEQAYLVVV